MNNRWMDLNGRVVCEDHLGGYATAALSRRPKAKRITTPITSWERLGTVVTIPCEDCDYAAKRSAAR